MNEASAAAADERPTPAAPLALRVGAVGLAAPSLCACCLATASTALQVVAPSGPSALIHYCGACHAHGSAARTRVLAASIASSALGLGVAALFLIAWGSYAVPLQTLAVLAAATLPLLPLLGGRPAPGHAARGPAVWWRLAPDTTESPPENRPEESGDWELVVANHRWARLVAREHALETHVAEGATPPRPRWLLAPLLVLAALPTLAVHFLAAPVRLLNRTDEPAAVLVDGRLRGTVPPTSAESPHAGLALDVVAGERRLTLVGRSGRVLADVTAGLTPGVDHLFAASTTPICFWLERASYGRASSERGVPRPRREALLGQGPLWALPYRVDSWFAANPPPDENDQLSSGGERIALRQGRCLVGTERPPIILPAP